MEGTSGLGLGRWQNAFRWAEGANVRLRRSALYRAAEYHLAAQHGAGARTLAAHQFAVDGLGDFANHDQDTDRPEWARKLQLTFASKRACESLAALVHRCAQTNTNNPVILRQLKQISDSVIGPRTSASEARAYLRRAALKLHPDRCGDLEGWRIPHIGYSTKMPAQHRYEQAKWGAEGLYALHRSLDCLYRNPHYQRALYAPTAVHGGSLKPPHVMAEYTLASAVMCTLFPRAMGCAGVGAAAIAAWWLVTFIRHRRAKQAAVTCRALIPFVEPPSLHDAAGEHTCFATTLP